MAHTCGSRCRLSSECSSERSSMLRSGDPGTGMGRGKNRPQRCRWVMLNVICRSAYRKEIESLNQERKEVLLVLSQITSMRKAMLRGRDCMELQCLLQTKNQYDSMIRDRKVLLVDVDNQVRASGTFPG